MKSLRILDVALVTMLIACSSGSKTSGFSADDGNTGSDGSSPLGNNDSDGGNATQFGGDGSSSSGVDGAGGTSTTVTTIYANTDDSLYSLNPQTQAVTLIGKFAGVAASDTVTDVAVDSKGDVFVNTETVVYKAQLPAAAGGAVQLTSVATIAAKSSFYALAFAPAGALGATEMLVGGDANGELWSIDPASGATKDLGSFGKDPSDSSKVLALSGDVVFYTDGSGKPTGLATIRACGSGGSSCTTSNDYLAGIDMTALSAAYTSGTPATSLLLGIYGGSTGKTGSGIGHGNVYGLGAWQGDVYGFSRSESSSPPVLLQIDTTTGAGVALPGSFPFTNGWSGAGVSTSTTVTVPAPSKVN